MQGNFLTVNNEDDFSKSKIIYLTLIVLASCKPEIEGRYLYVNEGNCHFLPYYNDTLVLHNDGRVESRNFPTDSVFEVEGQLVFGRKIKVSSEEENSYSYLLLERGVFDDYKLLICMDQVGYYVKY